MQGAISHDRAARRFRFRGGGASGVGARGSGQGHPGPVTHRDRLDAVEADKVALAGGIFVVFLILVSVFASPIIAAFGHPPLEFHQDAIDQSTLLPKGNFGGVSSEYLLGVEPVNGRDIFSRIVAGAGISLLIGFLATLVSVLIGTVLGVLAGYFGGWVDQVIGRIMDVFLAFPLLVFAIALAGVVPDKGFGLEGNGLRVAMLVFIIGFFSWPSIGRIVRGQTLSLRSGSSSTPRAASGHATATSCSARSCPT